MSSATKYCRSFLKYQLYSLVAHNTMYLYLLSSQYFCIQMDTKYSVRKYLSKHDNVYTPAFVDTVLPGLSAALTQYTGLCFSYFGVMNTMWYYYNMVILLPNTHNKHSIAHPQGQGISRLQSVIIELCNWGVVQNILLTHWGRVTHICVVKLTIIGSDNGLSPGRRQAIIWTNAGILLMGPLGTNFSENLIAILTFSFTKNAIESVICEMAAILSWPQCVKIN